jgi:hypothetical protein
MIYVSTYELERALRTRKPNEDLVVHESLDDFKSAIAIIEFAQSFEEVLIELNRMK